MSPRYIHKELVLIGTFLLLFAVSNLVIAQSITYLGVIRDRTDFGQLNIGKAGYWFPQFGSKKPVAGRPTDENARNALPMWAGPLNHVSSFLDGSYSTRTFSQDGPARSKGGQPKWNEFILPNGKTGRSGAIVDPHACKNANNTINRIQLGKGTPGTFFFHIVTDNTNREHDPVLRLQARGNANGADLEADTSPKGKELAFNGIADVYTFRFDGFREGDFIKVRLKGDQGQTDGPGIGGFLFDTAFEPKVALPPESATKNANR
jgi:hypothetical protein